MVNIFAPVSRIYPSALCLAMPSICRAVALTHPAKLSEKKASKAVMLDLVPERSNVHTELFSGMRPIPVTG